MTQQLSFSEIMDIVKSKVDSVSDFAYEDFDKDKLELGPIKNVNHYGGEGQGEKWYVVFHFVDHDIYIRVDGFYSSYNGTDFYGGWGDCKEVTPKTKTLVVYE